MTRSAAATNAGRRRALPRQPAPQHPRRVSGPAAPPRRQPGAGGALAASAAVAYPRPQRAPRAPARPPLRVVAGGAAIATRVADIALDVSTSRVMDRLVRSRMWIGIVAFGLIGIVAMQVSMLKLNAGIGRAVETESTLERTNASLRGDISRLSNGDRIQSLAGARGFVMPAPADVTYLTSHDPRADAVRAARRMQSPNRAIAGPAGSAAESAAAAQAAPVAAPPAAAATTTAAAPAAGTAAATPLQTTAPPVQAAAPPAAPASAAPPAAPAQVAAPTAAPATAASPSGGVAPATTPGTP